MGCGASSTDVTATSTSTTHTLSGQPKKGSWAANPHDSTSPAATPFVDLRSATCPQLPSPSLDSHLLMSFERPLNSSKPAQQLQQEQSQQLQMLPTEPQIAQQHAAPPPSSPVHEGEGGGGGGGSPATVRCDDDIVDAKHHHNNIRDMYCSIQPRSAVDQHLTIIASLNNKCSGGATIDPTGHHDSTGRDDSAIDVGDDSGGVVAPSPWLEDELFMALAPTTFRAASEQMTDVANTTASSWGAPCSKMSSGLTPIDEDLARGATLPLQQHPRGGECRYYLHRHHHLARTAAPPWREFEALSTAPSAHSADSGVSASSGGSGRWGAKPPHPRRNSFGSKAGALSPDGTPLHHPSSSPHRRSHWRGGSGAPTVVSSASKALEIIYTSPPLAGPLPMEGPHLHHRPLILDAPGAEHSDFLPLHRCDADQTPPLMSLVCLSPRREHNGHINPYHANNNKSRSAGSVAPAGGSTSSSNLWCNMRAPFIPLSMTTVMHFGSSDGVDSAKQSHSSRATTISWTTLMS